MTEWIIISDVHTVEPANLSFLINRMRLHVRVHCCVTQHPKQMFELEVKYEH
jgi:hypothetical protein